MHVASSQTFNVAGNGYSVHVCKGYMLCLNTYSSQFCDGFVLAFVGAGDR